MVDPYKQNNLNKWTAYTSIYMHVKVKWGTKAERNTEELIGADHVDP